MTTPLQRRRIYDAYGRTCHICGRSIDSLDHMDIDHLIPKKQGGSDDIDNLRPAHARCNRVKQATVAHLPQTHQLRLLATSRPDPSSSSIARPEETICEWMRQQLAAGPQDFGFCQRVVDFARKHIDASLSDKAGVELYLNLCKQLNLVTKHIDGHFVTSYAEPEKPKSIFWDGK